MVAEALECLGGNGYVEENGLARLYREAPLNSIWEGSGNVNALDVVRALTREPASLAALGKELALPAATTACSTPRSTTASAAGALALGPDAPWGARRLVERLALTLQAALLVRHSPGPVADAFVASRLGGDHGGTFGTLGVRRSGRMPCRLLARSARSGRERQPLLLRLDVEVGRRPLGVHRLELPRAAGW